LLVYPLFMREKAVESKCEKIQNRAKASLINFTAKVIIGCGMG
jgi:hypothetical protein